MRNVTQLDDQINRDLKRQSLLEAISVHLSNTRQTSQQAARAILSDWRTDELEAYANAHRIDPVASRVAPGTIEIRLDNRLNTAND